jgi:cellulose synthase/poly-beta-1,6-N-acetylglucosamine synthase-like glycosyltransferase
MHGMVAVMTELNAMDLTRKVRAALRIFVKGFRRLGEVIAHASVVIYPFSLFQETYSPEDNTIVVLYSDDDSRFSDYLPRTNPNTAIKLRRVKVSLIATAYNEAENIQSWIDSIFNQTRLPDEIIVTDAGSSDNT